MRERIRFDALNSLLELGVQCPIILLSRRSKKEKGIQRFNFIVGKIILGEAIMARFKLKKENYSFVVSDDPEDYCTTCDNLSITRPQRFIPLQGE